MAKLKSGTRIYGSAIIDTTLSVSGGDIITGAAVASKLFSTTTTAAIEIGAALTTGTLRLGSANGSGAINIGNTGTSAAQAVNIATATTGTISIGGPSSLVNIATGSATGTVQIGTTTAAAQQILIAPGTTSTISIGGTGSPVNIATGASTGAVQIGSTTASAQNITIGGTTTGTINIGSVSGANTVNVGSTSSTAVNLPTGKVKVGQTFLLQGVAGDITFPSSAGTLALTTNTLFVGTTSIALNRASAAQSLTGITSIDGSAATLTTTRTLWGQNFNGSDNVTGSLSSVGDITGTGAVTLTATSATLNLTATGANVVTINTNGNERARIDSSGRLLVGTSTSIDLNAGVQSVGTSAYRFEGFRFGSDNAVMTLGSANGTQASPSVLTAPNFGLGFIQFRSYDGAAYRDGAWISAVAESEWALSDCPTRLTFSTTAAGASSPTERMRITSAGDVGIGLVDPTQKLHVNGNARITGAIYDSDNSAGTSGQVLTSTATGTQWASSSGGVDAIEVMLFG